MSLETYSTHSSESKKSRERLITLTPLSLFCRKFFSSCCDHFKLKPFYTPILLADNERDATFKFSYLLNRVEELLWDISFFVNLVS